jgi:hypothetical protein
MKLKSLLFFAILAITSCNELEDNYKLCDSNYIYCNFFEIQFPEISQITDDNAQLSVEDLSTYRKLSQEHKNNSSSNSIFDNYTEIFIPRFSYNILDVNSLEKLWFGLALYPLDQRNNLSTVTDYFYNDFQTLNQSIYGECLRDKNSYLDTENSKIYNCVKDGLYSYDFWVSDEEFMWRMKCVWQENNFEGVNLKILKTEVVRSSDTCRKSFESFKSKIN